MGYLETPSDPLNEAQVSGLSYTGAFQSNGPFYENGSECSTGGGSTYDYTLLTADGVGTLVPVAYPFSSNGITIPLDYAMVYRINVDDAFLNGLNALSVESFTIDTTMIGKGGAWQVFLNTHLLASGAALGNSLELYNDGSELKDKLRNDSTNYLYLSVKGALVTGLTSGASVDCSYLKARLNMNANYTTLSYPITGGGGGQVIHGGGG